MGEGFTLGAFKGQQNPAANVSCVFQGLQARRILLPFRMTEIGVGSTCGHNQKIVRQFQSVRANQSPVQIKTCNFAQKHLSIAGMAQHIAYGRGNFRRGKHRQRHLIKQRLKCMVVLAVQQSYPNRSVFEYLGRIQPGKAPAHYHHARPTDVLCHR